MRSVDSGGNVVNAIGPGRRDNDQQRTFYNRDMKLYSTLSGKLLHDDLRLHTLSPARPSCSWGRGERRVQAGTYTCVFWWYSGDL